MDDEQKFSALSHGSRRTDAARTQPSDPMSFQRIVNELRAELALASADGSGELQHDMLNRAVLGYEEERKRLYALIEQRLLQRRLFDGDFTDASYSSLAEAVFAEIVGMNVLELVLKNREGLEEVQVAGVRIFEVCGGVSRLSPYTFKSVGEVERLQQNLVLFNHDTLNARKRWAEVRLSDGSRVTMTGFGFTAEPTVTIRFHKLDSCKLMDLCEPPFCSLDRRSALLLRAIVTGRINLVIIGATNTGKTHLLKALIGEMPDDERIVTMESRFELMIRQSFPGKNVIEYEVTEDDALHDGQQAFKLALRQSPVRIIHAEIRDRDANLYVRACTRGHAGSMTTLHADSLEDVPGAIADMCMQDGRVVDPERLVRRIVRHVTRIGVELAAVDGQRLVLRIAEFEQCGSDAYVRTILQYDGERREWRLMNKLSPELSARIRRINRAIFSQLLEAGMVNAC